MAQWYTKRQRKVFLLLFVTALRYTVKAASFTKAFYFKMIYVTCLAHGLHWRNGHQRKSVLFSKVNELIANMKKVSLITPVQYMC